MFPWDSLRWTAFEFMARERMHADEIATDVPLVRRLLARQFPQWADLPVEPASGAGTDHAIYRLGDSMSARLPRLIHASRQPALEFHWLPRLAPRVPLPIPQPVAVGRPAEGYPFPWSIHRWIEGENATLDRLADPQDAARQLAGFIGALQKFDTTGAPASPRCETLASRDVRLRAALADCSTILDAATIAAATTAWDDALRASPSQNSPVWIHGDLQAGNLLAKEGRLSAVIDFGCAGLGDPATDVMSAWLCLPATCRKTFRATLGVDDPTWRRARGWALSVGLIALPYYRVTNPILAAIARRAIGEVIADRA